MKNEIWLYWKIDLLKFWGICWELFIISFFCIEVFFIFIVGLGKLFVFFLYRGLKSWVLIVVERIVDGSLYFEGVKDVFNINLMVFVLKRMMNFWYKKIKF